MFGRWKAGSAGPVMTKRIGAALGFAAALSFAGSAMTQPAGYFSAMAGDWKGDGRLKLASGSTERIRCRAKNSVKENGNSLRQDLRCAGDSYKLSFSSDLTYKKSAGVVTGTWREKNYNVGGFIMGPARPGFVRASVDHDSFSAEVSVVTKGNKQLVTITPKGLDVTQVSVTLVRLR